MRYTSPVGIAGHRTATPMTIGLELERLDEVIEALRNQYSLRVKAERWSEAREFRRILERRLAHRRLLVTQVLREKSRQEAKRKLAGMVRGSGSDMIVGSTSHV